MKKPNVLWIFPDQLRPQALSCYGDPNIRTPHIDRLADEGVRFDAACSQYPVCMPFRGGLITGQYAHVHSVHVHGDMLLPTPCTVAHAFRAAGWRTSWVGKWHLASAQSVDGWKSGADYWVHPYLRAGFEDWFGFDCSNHFYNTRYSDGEDIGPPKSITKYQTDGLTDISLEYLSEVALRGPQPWFHCLSVEAPHAGTDQHGVYRHCAPPEYEALFDPGRLVLRGNVTGERESEWRMLNRGYYAQIANLDWNVGRVLRLLEERRVLDDTLVLFFSDHGEMAGSHGMVEKGVVYEESLRIPLLARWPRKIRAGQVCDMPVSGIDIFPTTAGWCEIPVPNAVQGVDCSMAACGRPGPVRDAVYVQWLGRARYGFGNYQYRAIRTRRYTYAVGTRPDLCLLFDNGQDAWQQHNLFNVPGCRPLRDDLHQRLINAAVGADEAVPEFLA